MNPKSASRTGCVGILAGSLLLPAVAQAQTAAAPAAPPSKAMEASLGHAMEKAITLKLATFSLGTLIYSFGTGSLAAGSTLSAVNAAASFVIYSANDYMWDYLWPNTNISANNETFHKTASVTRNTAKYLTFKPAVTVLNVGTIYWFTGSVAATAATGTVATLALPLMFYANNTLWDWYDWRATSGDPKPQASAAMTLPAR
jgi:uncharacterized membrane protein